MRLRAGAASICPAGGAAQPHEAAAVGGGAAARRRWAARTRLSSISASTSASLPPKVMPLSRRAALLSSRRQVATTGDASMAHITPQWHWGERGGGPLRRARVYFTSCAKRWEGCAFPILDDAHDTDRRSRLWRVACGCEPLCPRARARALALPLRTLSGGQAGIRDPTGIKCPPMARRPSPTAPAPLPAQRRPAPPTVCPTGATWTTTCCTSSCSTSTAKTWPRRIQCAGLGGERRCFARGHSPSTARLPMWSA